MKELFHSMDFSSSSSVLDAKPSTPLLSSTTSRSENSEESPVTSKRFDLEAFKVMMVPIRFPCSNFHSYKSLAVLSGHIGSVSCLALCGEFILSGSQGKDIIVWQQPDLRQFTKFGSGEGSVKALVSIGNKVFTAHQDSRIRVWKVSRSSENVFRLSNSLPTAKDYMGNFMKQSNYVQTRRHHKRLWIEHADSISCLTVCNGLIYSGSWDKTLKVWRISDFKCLESIKAHDDAINGLVSSRGRGIVYSASADGKIKAWGTITKGQGKNTTTAHCLKGIMEGHKDVSLNSVVVSEDGNLVYGGGSDGYIMGWLADKDLGGSCLCWNWKVICEVKAHQMAILCMCLRGEEFVCSGSADRSIGIWKREINGGIFRIGIIKGHEGPVKCLQASPRFVGGGFMLYSGSLDKSIRVWWVPNYNNSSRSGTEEEDSTCLLNSN